MTKTHAHRFFRTSSLLAICGAALLFSGSAAAEKRCTSKPAVCMRLKAQEARKVEQPAPSQERASTKAPEKRCTSKPAVCMRLEAQKAQKAAAEAAAPAPKPAAAPAPKAPVKRCTSKPAVCMRLGLGR